jgi:large subunit ribosomal protein L4
MTITVDKVTAEGEKKGTVTLTEAIFGLNPNSHVMHLAVRRELANGRAGTANTKTRAEVRGGGRKPWKQKGTGRARAGSIRSPLWNGGGVIFGPKPRSFVFEMPKKMRRLAMKSALSVAAQEQKLYAVEDFKFLSAPKTKQLNEWITKLGLKEKKVLVLAHYKADENQNLFLAARNLPELKLRLPLNLSVKDLILADAVIATEQALEEINERFGNHDNA